MQHMQQARAKAVFFAKFVDLVFELLLQPFQPFVIAS